MKKIFVIPVITAIAVIAVYYASPLFINATVDEPLPTLETVMEKMEGKSMVETAMNKEIVPMADKAVSGKGMSEESVPMVVLHGSFMGGGDGIHNAEGIARVLSIDDGSEEHKILRLEDFRSTNGPDLYVVLSKGAKGIGSGYVEVGRLKGNIGNQNYHIPDGINLEEYSHVLIWCKQFSVLFGSASLIAA
jgi:hypothetical protein